MSLLDDDEEDGAGAGDLDFVLFTIRSGQLQLPLTLISTNLDTVTMETLASKTMLKF